MSGFISKKENLDGWRETALKYAEHRGWCVVPLHVNPDQLDEEGDPVVEQLGMQPLGAIPEDATAVPARIREWDGIPRQTPIGILTGQESGIVALEVPREERTALTERDLDRLRDILPDTLRVHGPDRAYHLFARSEEGPQLPAITRFSGPSDQLVLHGEHSVIRAPGPSCRALSRTYTWDLTGPETAAPFPPELLSFFGIQLDVDALCWWRERMGPDGTDSVPAADGRRRRTEKKDNDAAPQDQSTASAGNDPSRERGLPFRSGDDLTADRLAADDLAIPWLSRGAVSLLSGASKTSGKSTFVLNLAAHLAQGRSFLGWTCTAQPVVLLSDLPAPACRSMLRSLNLDREARARLHIVHPSDAVPLSWTALLERAFEHVRRSEAGLLIVDSLDQFVAAKSGLDPTTNAEVVHRLTTESPASCALLLVKALGTSPPVQTRRIIDRLNLLGTAADMVLHMEEDPTSSHPTLRRLRLAGRLHPAPSYVLCEMVHGRYRPVPIGKQDGRAGTAGQGTSVLSSDPERELPARGATLGAEHVETGASGETMPTDNAPG